MEFSKLIDENAALREYFVRFPKLLMILVCQRKVARWDKTGKNIVVNCDLLQKYLVSEQSSFEIESLHDFLHSLSILGFHRYVLPEAKETKFLCFRFVNPNFEEGQLVSDDLYKIPVDSSSYLLKNKKKILTNETVQFLQRLSLMLSRQELMITNLELCHLKLQFALQKKLRCVREEQELIEFVIDEPDYVKNNEIAGYYGNVSIEALRNGFEDFFPIYQTEEVAQPTVSTPEDEIMDIVDVPLLAGEKTQLDTQENNCSIDSIMKEEFDVQEEVVETVAAKKRRLSKNPGFSKNETEDALMYMFKEQAKSLKVEE